MYLNAILQKTVLNYIIARLQEMVRIYLLAWLVELVLLYFLPRCQKTVPTLILATLKEMVPIYLLANMKKLCQYISWRDPYGMVPMYLIARPQQHCQWSHWRREPLFFAFLYSIIIATTVSLGKSFPQTNFSIFPLCMDSNALEKSPYKFITSKFLARTHTMIKHTHRDTYRHIHRHTHMHMLHSLIQLYTYTCRNITTTQ